MKTKTLITLLSCILLALILVFVLLISTDRISIGSDQENTMQEAEITPDYLMKDFPQQLVDEGAALTLSEIGEIKPSGEQGFYETVLQGKEAFPSSETSSGYTITDSNTLLPVVLGPETRIVYSDNNSFVILSTEEFVTLHNENVAAIANAEEIANIDKSELNEDEIMELESQKLAAVERYYNVYTTGTQTLLIIPFVFTPTEE